MGGCRKDASKYKFQNLISKFELYNVDPPVLKEGYDCDTARICREHNRLPPKKYQEDERPEVGYETTIDFGIKEEDSYKKNELKSPHSDLEEDAEHEEESSGSDEWKINAENENAEQEVSMRVVRASSRCTRSSGRVTASNRQKTSPPAQERHCIYLKVEDDERCREVAQNMGLARGPNGYNRSALLAKVPVIAAENSKLREQVANMQDKIITMGHSIITTTAGYNSPNATVPSPPTVTCIDEVALVAYDEIHDRLSTLKKTEEPSSWVQLLMKNLTEEEIMEIVNTYGGGRLRKRIREYSEIKENDSQVPDNSSNNMCFKQSGNGRVEIKREPCLVGGIYDDNIIQKKKRKMCNKYF